MGTRSQDTTDESRPTEPTDGCPLAANANVERNHGTEFGKDTLVEKVKIEIVVVKKQVRLCCIAFFGGIDSTVTFLQVVPASCLCAYRSRYLSAILNKLFG
jgi:hypothetical protein